jgi:hypothetical protein
MCVHCAWKARERLPLTWFNSIFNFKLEGIFGREGDYVGEEDRLFARRKRPVRYKPFVNGRENRNMREGRGAGGKLATTDVM